MEENKMKEQETSVSNSVEVKDEEANGAEPKKKGPGCLIWIIGLVGIMLAIYFMVTGEDKKYINLVKEGALNDFPTMAIGETFDKFFDDGEWIHSVGDYHHVEFKGTCDINGIETDVKVWFQIEEDMSCFYFMGGYVEGNPAWPTIEDVVYGAFLGDISKSNSTYILKKYISECITVDTDTLGRNPDKYIGKNVRIEGKISNIAGSLSIGIWDLSHSIFIEYDDAAYDSNFNLVGNVLHGDSGYVVGEFVGNDTIVARAIILTDY